MRLLLKIVLFYGAVWELGPFSPNTRGLCRQEPLRGGSPLEGGDPSEGDRDHRGDVATASPPKAGAATRPGPQARLRGGAGRGAARRAARVPDATPAPPPPRARRATTGRGRGRDPTRPAQSEVRPHPGSLAVCQSDAERGGSAWASWWPHSLVRPRSRGVGGAWPGRGTYKGGRRRRRHFANGEQRRGRGEAQRRFSWFRTPAAGW